jgi:hypothetical protein
LGTYQKEEDYADEHFDDLKERKVLVKVKWFNNQLMSHRFKGLYREYLRGKYHCTIDLLFDWFGLFFSANKNKNCQLSYS